MASPSSDITGGQIVLGLFILALPIIANIIIIGSAIWVYLDAKKYQQAGVKILSPEVWGILTFLMWIVCFPLYLILKYTKYQKLLAALPFNPTPPPVTPTPPPTPPPTHS